MPEETIVEIPKLYKHGACAGCTKKCKYNAPVAIKEVAERTNGRINECNSKFRK